MPVPLGKSLDALRFLVERGPRWTPDDRAVADTTRALYRVDGEAISIVVELLRTHHACDDKVLANLVRTEKMRNILAEANRRRASAERHPKRVAGQRGLRSESPAPAKATRARFPPSRYDRQRLYDEVWTEPTHQVARRYGVSDVVGARYDLALPPTFKLVPPPEREAALRRDYQAMHDMYMSEPQSFERILSTLADVERQVNGREGRS